jgi:hypothetical protein
VDNWGGGGIRGDQLCGEGKMVVFGNKIIGFLFAQSFQFLRDYTLDLRTPPGIAVP